MELPLKIGIEDAIHLGCIGLSIFCFINWLKVGRNKNTHRGNLLLNLKESKS